MSTEPPTDLEPRRGPLPSAAAVEGPDPTEEEDPPDRRDDDDDDYDDNYDDDYDEYGEDSLDPPTPQQRAGLWSDGLLGCVLLAGPQLLGIVHLWTWAGALCLSTAAFGLALYAHDDHRLPARPLTWALGLALFGSFLSLLPLPPGVLGHLSPQALAIWEAAGNLRAWPTIHLDPGAGSLGLIRLLTGATVAAACAQRLQARGWPRRMLGLIAVAGFLAASTAILQTVYGSFPVLRLFPGVRPPSTTFLPPLINANHWAGYTTLGALVSLNLSFSAKESPPVRLLAGVAACALAAAAVAGGSRGAPIGLLVGTMTTLGLRLLGSRNRSARRKARDRLAPRAIIVTAAMATAGACVWIVVAQTPTSLSPHTGLEVGGLEDEGRLRLLPSALALIEPFKWTGVGRGGVYDVLPRYQEFGTHQVLRWIEVFPLDVLAAYGLPVGGALLLSLLWLLLGAVRSSLQDPDRAGAAGALVALAVHELADFSTETGVVFITSIVLASVALGNSSQRPARRSLPAAVGALPLVALLVLQPALRHWDAGSWMAQARAEVERNERTWEEVANESRRWHPASFPNALYIAEAYSENGSLDKALPWLNRAQQLAPKHPLPHLMTARLLRAIGAKDQALVEYRLTLEHGWNSHARSVLGELSRSYPNVDDFLGALPNNQPESLGIAALVLQDIPDPRARELGLKALEETRQFPASLVAGAWALYKEGRGDEAKQVVRDAWKRTDLSLGVRFRLAKIIGNAGDRKTELDYLEYMCGTLHANDPWIWLHLGRVRIELGDRPGGRIALRKARSGPTEGRFTALSLLDEAKLEHKAGRSEFAVQLAERSLGVDGSILEAHLLIATLQLEMGRLDRASRAHRRAQILAPRNAQVVALGARVLERKQRVDKIASEREGERQAR